MTIKTREPARSVAHLPELLSATYRNRVRKLSPGNRNQMCPASTGIAHIKIHSHSLPKSDIRRPVKVTMYGMCP